MCTHCLLPHCGDFNSTVSNLAKEKITTYLKVSREAKPDTEIQEEKQNQ
jgi:hypothetical protein